MRDIPKSFKKVLTVSLFNGKHKSRVSTMTLKRMFHVAVCSEAVSTQQRYKYKALHPYNDLLDD